MIFVVRKWQQADCGILPQSRFVFGQMANFWAQRKNEHHRIYASQQRVGILSILQLQKKGNITAPLYFAIFMRCMRFFRNKPYFSHAFLGHAQHKNKETFFMNVKTTLKQNYEFRRLYRRGKSAASRLLVVYALPTKRTDSRIGLTVNVKLGGAVARNRCKRLLREAYRLQKSQMQGSYDFVFVARGGLVEADCQAACKSMQHCFAQLGLLEENKQQKKQKPANHKQENNKQVQKSNETPQTSKKG